MANLDKLLKAVQQDKKKTLSKDEEVKLGTIIQSPTSTKISRQKAIEKFEERKIEYEKIDFEPPSEKYPGEVCEVVLGATKSDGGTRSHAITIGGEKAPPFYDFEAPMPNKPVVTLDTFDMPIHTTREIKRHFVDVWEDPAEWAKKSVNEFGAEMITLHLISTDPAIKDTSASEAAKTVEDVLQAVKVPLVIGGSGNPDKDPEVLEKAAEAAEGENVLIASANLNMDYKRIAEAAKKYGHNILSWTQMDINSQKKLNKELLDLNIPKEKIVIDPTTAALGYGLEYSVSIMERIRLAALKGDNILQMPMSSGTTNNWGAREAWMNVPEWGPRELRGPLWESTGSISLMLCGVNLFMMLHPLSVSLFKETRDYLLSAKREEFNYYDWLKV